MENRTDSVKPHIHAKVCQHETGNLHYCQICDIVYCEKCGQEWGPKVTWTTTTTNPQITTWGGGY